MNRIIMRTIIFLTIILLISQVSIAQENNRDFESWTSVAIEYKLNKKWTFELEEQVRLKENSSVVDQYFTQLCSEYSLSDKFEFGSGIRYIKNNDTQGKIQGYENHFRFHFDASFQHKISRSSLKYRVRYQNKNELESPATKEEYADQCIRLKTSFTHDIRNWKLDPSISLEIFNNTDNIKIIDMSKYRLSIGTKYKIRKIGEIKLLYRMEKYLNNNSKETVDIIKISYTYIF